MVEKIAVIGAGLMGASTAYHLASLAKQTGQEIDITVYEASPDATARGGSVGASRITRLNTRDVPAVCLDMIQHSNEQALAWGCVRPAHAITIGNWKEKLDPAREVAKAQNVRHSVLDSQDIADKYPYFNSKGFLAVDEEAMTASGDGAGVIDPSKLIATQLKLAREAGAKVHFGTKIQSVAEDANGVTLTLPDGKNEHFDRVVSAAGVWTSKLLAGQHAATDNVITGVDPVFLYQVPEEQKASMQDFPSVMLKVKGGDEFARQHPEFVAQHPEFAKKEAYLQIYMMTEYGGPDGKDLFLKIGWCPPMEKAPNDPDQLIAKASVTQKDQCFISNIMKAFMPGVAQKLPSLQAAKADQVIFGPYGCAPDYTPIISPLHADSRITVVAADAGTSGKFSIATGKYAASYALGHPELIPENVRHVFSIDREMGKATMPEQAALGQTQAAACGGKIR